MFQSITDPTIWVGLFTDPSLWVGLFTLIILEIVLGIDNLVFVAILASKLPPHQRDKARYWGLALALGMRIALLCAMAWLVALTEPWLTIFGHAFSGRDLIMMIGGFFLMLKGTMELHERLEPIQGHKSTNASDAIFWQVIVQIVVLDAIFSLDSVITAVGMVHNLAVMIIAVVVAIAIMMAASKALMNFVNKHPTVVILCLGFLMMIGFSLIIEGFGYHVPKGYLYAAIGFSALVELFNQLVSRGQARLLKSRSLRETMAEAVMTMIAGRKGDVTLGAGADFLTEQASETEVFSVREREMVEGVLTLAERTAKSIMTHRMEIEFIDLEAGEEEIRERILSTTFSRIPIARGSIDNFVGVAETADLLRLIALGQKLDIESKTSKAVVVHESTSALKLMERLRQETAQLAFILDEYGALEGIVTSTDILEAIAGEFPDADEEKPRLERQADGSWLVSGWADIRMVSKALEIDLVDETDRYETLAGYIMHAFGHQPEIGEIGVTAQNLSVEILSLDGRSVELVKIGILLEEKVDS